MTELEARLGLSQTRESFELGGIPNLQLSTLDAWRIMEVLSQSVYTLTEILREFERQERVTPRLEDLRCELVLTKNLSELLVRRRPGLFEI